MAKNGSKKIVQKEQVSGSKSPKNIEDPDSYYRKSPVWSFRLLDNNYMKWGFVHTKDINLTIISKLQEYEGMTWGEVIKATGGRSHGNNNHFENVSDLIPEARQRWKDLKLEEYDRVFSLRLTGEQRLYGILDNGTFKIIWFDQKHEIYQLSR